MTAQRAGLAWVEKQANSKHAPRLPSCPAQPTAHRRGVVDVAVAAVDGRLLHGGVRPPRLPAPRESAAGAAASEHEGASMRAHIMLHSAVLRGPTTAALAITSFPSRGT